MSSPPIVISCPISEDETQTDNQVLALRFSSGEVHTWSRALLEEKIIRFTNLKYEDILALYKTLGSRNVFYLEVPKDKDTSDLKGRVTILDRDVTFTCEDASLPRTQVQLNSVPVGVKDASLINIFAPYVAPWASAHEIAVIRTRRQRDDVRTVLIPLNPEKDLPHFIKFKAGNYELTAEVIVQGRRQRCLHCGSQGHFTFSRQCGLKPKAFERPRNFSQKRPQAAPQPLMSIDTSRPPVPPPAAAAPQNGSCLGFTQESQDEDSLSIPASSTPSNSPSESTSSPAPTSQPTLSATPASPPTQNIETPSSPDPTTPIALTPSSTPTPTPAPEKENPINSETDEESESRLQIDMDFVADSQEMPPPDDDDWKTVKKQKKRSRARSTSTSRSSVDSAKPEHKKSHITEKQ